MWAPQVSENGVLSMHSSCFLIPVIGAGIGKTMFAFWVLYQWARDGERVVLVKKHFFFGAPFLLSPDEVVKLSEDELVRELSDPATKYVACVICIDLYPQGDHRYLDMPL